jgi:O-antigen/teichoic acid export membrane protein
MAAPTAEARRFGRSAGLLSAGVGTAGVLTYLFFALASHNLEPREYGEVVVLWSCVFVSISVLYRPVEQLLSRSIAERRARDEPIGSALRVAAAIQGGVAVASGGAILILRGPLESGLFSGSAALYWVMFAAVLAFGASFFARGFLAGERRFALLAALLVAESASRAAFALAVAVGVASGQAAIALGIAAAPCVSLLVVPLAFGRRAAAVGTAAPAPPGDPAAGRLSIAHGGGFATAVLVIMLSEQALLNAGPLILRALQDAAAAGFIFNVLLLARAPLVVFQGVATSLLPHLTRLHARGGEAGQEAFRLSVTGTVRAVAAFTAAVAAVVAIAGPDLMQIAFGESFSYDRAGLLIVTAGMGLYLSATTLSQATVARGGVRVAAACWAGCALAFVAWCLVPVLDDARRVQIGFTAAAGLLAALLYRPHRRPGERVADRVAPGSPEELEARLAIADEAG